MNTLLVPWPTRGLTLVEMMVVVALLALVATLAAPGMMRLVESSRLRGVADQLMTDLQWARSEVLRRGAGDADVAITFGANAQLTCYSIHAGGIAAAGDCDCTQAPGSACSGGPRTELKTVQIPRNLGVSLAASGPGGSEVRLAPPLASASPAGMQIGVQGSHGGQALAIVNATGSPRLCTPNGSVNGLKPC